MSNEEYRQYKQYDKLINQLCIKNNLYNPTHESHQLELAADQLHSLETLTYEECFDLLDHKIQSINNFRINY